MGQIICGLKYRCLFLFLTMFNTINRQCCNVFPSVMKGVKIIRLEIYAICVNLLSI